MLLIIYYLKIIVVEKLSYIYTSRLFYIDDYFIIIQICFNK